MRWFGVLTMIAVACAPSRPGNDDAAGDDCDDSTCTVNGWQECADGQLEPLEPCDAVCVPDLGCVECNPLGKYCVDEDVYQCNADGSGGQLVLSCSEQEVCSNGVCVSACDKADLERSNIGCEYWAVDLDNEYSVFSDASAQQFAVALANASDFAVDVVVEQNDAQPGAAHQLSVVATVTIPPDSLEVIHLPRREVDGSLMGQNEGPGTWLSSFAYRITTNYPVVAYQFNPIIQQFSNGASLLIPTSGLDNDYWIVGWPTSNPIGFAIPEWGVPDHSAVTIVGVEEFPVTVQVTLTSDLLGGPGVPAAGPGDTIEVTLNKFDVLNLESNFDTSTPQLGDETDFTGTHVVASGRVAVFTGGERGSVPYGTGGTMPPPSPDWDGEDVCCTEHFEQQAFPTVSLGKEFVMTRSPPRSQDPDWVEGDILRVLATEPGTSVDTNLGAPFDHFDLEVGEWAEFWTLRDFVLRSNNPVVVAQYTVAQNFIPNPRVGGDPEFILFPPVEQYRKNYIFLVPPTFDEDWAVISAPNTALVTLDGANVSDEINPLCERYPAGLAAGAEYVAIRCELTDGVHHVDSNMPVGVTVYGYYNVGSYGYAAGAELKRINIP